MQMPKPATLFEMREAATISINGRSRRNCQPLKAAPSISFTAQDGIKIQPAALLPANSMASICTCTMRRKRTTADENDIFIQSLLLFFPFFICVKFISWRIEHALERTIVILISLSSAFRWRTKRYAYSTRSKDVSAEHLSAVFYAG